MKTLLVTCSLLISASTFAARGGCMIDPELVCMDYTFTNYDDNTLRKICEGAELEYFPKGCPSTNRVGRCLLKQDATGIANYHFYNMELDEAIESCTAYKGKFERN